MDKKLEIEKSIKTILNNKLINISYIFYTDCMLDCINGERLLYIVFYDKNDLGKFTELVKSVSDKSGLNIINSISLIIRGLTLQLILELITDSWK